MCHNSSKEHITDRPSKPHGEFMYDYLQSLDQVMEKVSIGLDKVYSLSSSLPNIPFVELSSEHDATMRALISTIQKLENDIHEADEAVKSVPEEGLVGILEVAGTPHIEARVETRHDVSLLKSSLKRADDLVEGMKELVKGWIARRALNHGDDGQ